MASRTDKFMYLDMEFYNADAFGFINFYNNSDTGENLGGGTVGFGNVEERRIGFYGTEHVDTFEIKNFNDVEVHNYKEENGEVTEYYDSQFIVKANTFKFSLQNPNEISSINLFTENLNDYIKVEANEDEGIIEENWNLDTPIGMSFNSSGSFGFVNQINNKMISVMDAVNEEFTWLGKVYADNYFSLDGLRVSYEGHTHDQYGPGAPDLKENGYFRYDADTNTWNKIEYTLIDEQYDIPSDAENDTFWYAEKEQQLYEKRNDSLYTLTINDEVEIVDDLPAPADGEVAYDLSSKRHYKYNESGDYWSYISPDSPLVIEVDHKSDIDLSTAISGQVYYITSTDKIYEYNGINLIENRPSFIYSDNNHMPTRVSDRVVYKVKGGTFYMYANSTWIEIDRPLEIPEIHYDNIDEYRQLNKIVFVTRRK